MGKVARLFNETAVPEEAVLQFSVAATVATITINLFKGAATVGAGAVQFKEAVAIKRATLFRGAAGATAPLQEVPDAEHHPGASHPGDN
jgi:hypothetical protein